MFLGFLHLGILLGRVAKTLNSTLSRMVGPRPEPGRLLQASLKGFFRCDCTLPSPFFLCPLPGGAVLLLCFLILLPFLFLHEMWKRPHARKPVQSIHVFLK